MLEGHGRENSIHDYRTDSLPFPHQALQDVPVAAPGSRIPTCGWESQDVTAASASVMVSGRSKARGFVEILRKAQSVSQARRVDFLFLMKKSTGGLRGCLRQELFGQPTTLSARPGSDHYGVLDTYIADPPQCS